MSIQDHPFYAEIETERQIVFETMAAHQAHRLKSLGYYVQWAANPPGELDGLSLVQFRFRGLPGPDFEGWPSMPDEQALSGVRCQYFASVSGEEYTLGARLVWEGVEYIYLSANGFWWEVSE